MMGNECDTLRDLDWSKVYDRAPGEMDDAVRAAFLRIRQHDQRRQRLARTLRRAACVAACAALVASASLLLLKGRGRAPDQVAAPAPGTTVLRDGDEVYASRAEGRFHVRRDCPKAEGECVALELVTALEFGKELCPDCGANYALEP